VREQDWDVWKEPLAENSEVNLTWYRKSFRDVEQHANNCEVSMANSEPNLKSDEFEFTTSRGQKYSTSRSPRGKLAKKVNQRKR